MKITSEELHQHPLVSCYLVCGDEVLLADEVVSQIRQQAAAQGFQKETTIVVSGFDWNKWLQDAKTSSLFNPKRLLLCRCPVKLLNQTAAEALESYLKHPPPNTILLLITQKLDAVQQKKSWIAAFDTKGVVVRLISPTGNAFLPWLQKRLFKKNLKLNKDAIQQLASFTEGNLLAADQAIQQLALTYKDAGVLDSTHIEACIQHDARYDIYLLAESCLTADSARTLQIVRTLQADAEPALVLWAIAKEMRQVATLAFYVAQKKPLPQLFKTYNVWSKKQALYQKILEKHPFAYWQNRINGLAQLDEVLKTNQGDFWRELETWCVV